LRISELARKLFKANISKIFKKNKEREERICEEEKKKNS